SHSAHSVLVLLSTERTGRNFCLGRFRLYAKSMNMRMLDCSGLWRSTRKSFGVQLTVKYGSLDRADYIDNIAVWPEIILLDCYAHVSKKCHERCGLLKDNTCYDKHVRDNTKQMHHARSPEQFAALSHECVKIWETCRGQECASWFKKVYLHERWSRMYATCAIPGSLPSQNALESHNGVIKTCGVTEKNAKTGFVLNKSKSGVFAIVELDTGVSTFGHCWG
ncbi:hypothetical protein JG688_00017777, partial [Phytophthora aleatoria]